MKPAKKNPPAFAWRVCQTIVDQQDCLSAVHRLLNWVDAITPDVIPTSA